MSSLKETFSLAAGKVSKASGTAWAFLGAVLVIVVWVVTGPLFGFSDTWQLVINTGTTIVTFLMVFLIQNTQYKDMRAVHLKLDELLAAMEGASNRLIDVEERPDHEVEQLDDEFRAVARRLRNAPKGIHASIDDHRPARPAADR